MKQTYPNKYTSEELLTSLADSLPFLDFPSLTARNVFNRLLTTIGNQPLIFITLTFEKWVSLDQVKRMGNSYLANTKKLSGKFQGVFRVFEEEENKRLHIHYIIHELDLPLFLKFFKQKEGRYYGGTHGIAHISPNDGQYSTNIGLFWYLTKSIYYPSKTIYAFSRKDYRRRTAISKYEAAILFPGTKAYLFIPTCDDSCINTCCRQSCVYSTCICAQHQTNCQGNHGHSPPLKRKVKNAD